LTYSIFIPTLPNNILLLERTLESINSNIQISMEVIVSSHFHCTQIQELVSQYPFAKYLSFPESNNGSKYILYNLSLFATSGEYIVLLSDNVIVSKEWSEALVKTKGDFTCGKVSVSEHSIVPKKFLKSLFSFYGETNFSEIKTSLEPDQFLLVDNFIIRREFLKDKSSLSMLDTFIVQLTCTSSGVNRIYDPSLHIFVIVKDYKFTNDFLFNRSMEIKSFYRRLNSHIHKDNKAMRIARNVFDFSKYTTLLYFRPINDCKRFYYQLQRNKIPFN